MKDFFKRNLYVIIFSFAGFICLFLGTFFAILLPVGTLVLSVPMIILTIKSKKKYDNLKNYSGEENIFDATKLDYDEEVYYIGGDKNEKKNQIKGAFSKFNAMNPIIIFGFLSIALIIMSIIGFLNINY